MTVFGPFDLSRGRPALVIAEVGVNHNGDRDLGLRQLRAAAATGARAVKFQSFRASELAAVSAPKAEYQKGTAEPTQHAMLRSLELDTTDLEAFMAEGRRLGVVVFSTPFDPQSAAELARSGVELMKIPSGEITNLDLIAAVARTKLPTIISTGMSELDEVRAAVRTHRDNGGGPIALLHCVSSYPAPVEDMNLLAIVTLRERFDVPVGLSDHSRGIEAAIAAVALGAVIVEKHFTVDRSLPGPDHAMSTEPDEFATLVATVERVRKGLGDGRKAPMPIEMENRRLGRRSLVAATAIPAGTVLTRDLLAAKRPAGGLTPGDADSLVGRRTTRALEPDEMVLLTDVE